MVFTERAIPTLVKQGIEWVIVANNHISRACEVRGRREGGIEWVIVTNNHISRACEVRGGRDRVGDSH